MLFWTNLNDSQKVICRAVLEGHDGMTKQQADEWITEDGRRERLWRDCPAGCLFVFAEEKPDYLWR